MQRNILIELLSSGRRMNLIKQSKLLSSEYHQLICIYAHASTAVKVDFKHFCNLSYVGFTGTSVYSSINYNIIAYSTILFMYFTFREMIIFPVCTRVVKQ